MCEALWSSAPRKGHYTMLSHGGSDQDLRPPPKDLLVGPIPEAPGAHSAAGPASGFRFTGALEHATRSRPLGLDFDFLEVGCLSPATRVAQALGLRVGPPLLSTGSGELSALDPQVLDLLVYLVSRGRLRSILCWVPAWTFPWLSSRDRSLRPWIRASYGRNERLALRSLLLLRTCACPVSLLRRPGLVS